MKKKIVIIGAGVSGLSAAYFLKKENIVLEAKAYAGGLCSSFYENGFTFDCSGHFIHMRNEKIKKLVEKLSGGLTEIKRNSSIYMKSNFIPFPFQANLYYLDEKTKKECVDGLLKIKPTVVDPDMSFLEWSKTVFGNGITKHFMRPYNEKLWNYDLDKMSYRWSGDFVPSPDIDEMLKSAKSKNKKRYGYNDVFYYPKKDGCNALIKGFLKKIKPSLNMRVKQIDVKNKIVYAQEENCPHKEYGYSSLISTQPLPELIKQLSFSSSEIKDAVQKLRWADVRCFNLGFKSKNGIPKILKNRHWIYLPEKFPSFYRVGIYSNVNPSSAPKNCYSFYVETSSPKDEYKTCADMVDDLRKMGFVGKKDKFIASNVVDIPYAYPIINHEREKALKEINDFLKSINIYSIGRYGAWEYSFIEKNILAASQLAKKINSLP